MTRHQPDRLRYGHVARRVLLDVINEAAPAYWRRRALTFAAVGTATADESALACERHADLLTAHPLDCSELVDLVLQEMA